MSAACSPSSRPAHSPNWSRRCAQSRPPRRAGAAAPASADLHPARAALRRFWLDRFPPRRALCPGIRLGRAVRRPVRADRRRLRQQLRSEAGALLDRRDGWRECRLRHAGQGRAPGVARLRLLLVDPKARGLGLGTAPGRRMRQVRARGRLQEITLWTHSVLTAARRVYEKAGFTLTSSETRHSWGKDVVAEFWDLEL